MMTNQERLANVKEEIAKAALSVQSGDKSITKRHMSELLAAKSSIENDIAMETTPTRRVGRFYTREGL